MEVALVVLGLAVVTLIVCVVLFKTSDNFLNEVKTNPSYSLEKEILSLLGYSYSFTEKVIEKGAILAGKHTDSKYPELNAQYAVTTSALLAKVGSTEAAHKRVHFGIKNYQKEEVIGAYEASQKSVVGSAAVGALIGGAAGAVVGAVYAADKNAKGNSGKPITQMNYYYYIAICGYSVDKVYISKRLSKHRPPAEFIANETDMYWSIELPTIVNRRSELEAKLNYLNRIVNDQCG